uniref:Death domain-containing protein n=1 Tax=Haemonchus placei TaxID=6290 RepID=A0A0N4WVS1_HAEPC
LTREVRLLREALDGINFIDRAQRGNSPFPKGDETIPDSFTMPDEVVSIERPASGSRGTSAVEQARLSSRGSIQLLSDNAIRNDEPRSDGLTIRRFRIEGGPDHNSENHLREQGVNTHKFPVRHVVITHRVKHELDHGIGRTRFHIGTHHPEGKPHFHPFKLRTTLDSSQQIMDVDSIPHLGKRDETRDAIFDGRAARATIHGEEEKEIEHHPHKQRKGGGKRGRPVLVGRSLYSRGRVHFRPHVNFHPLPRGTSTDAEADSQESSPLAQETAAECERHDAAVMTEEPEVRDSANPKPDEVDNENDGGQSSPTIRRKSPDNKKLPFVGSGLKGADTFSIAGNQQQVMKVTSTRFQEWLPLVRSIIYDSRCKDYAQALRRDLARQKRSHSEQMRLLQIDLVECRSESERREIRDDIARLKQQWTPKHDRVLSCLNELISKGGVWSKVQQLRTIHSALVA